MSTLCKEYIHIPYVYLLYMYQYLHGWNAECWYGGHRVDDLSEHVDEGDEEDGLELAQPHVGYQRTEDRGEVAAQVEGVIGNLQQNYSIRLLHSCTVVIGGAESRY